MAAQEYYLGTQAAQELPGSHPPHPFSSQPQKPPQYQQPPAQHYPQPNVHNPAYANTPPPSYSAYSQQPQQQSHGYPPQQQYQPYPEKNAQAMTAPYPQTPPAGYFPHQQPMPQPQQAPLPNNGYLGAPLQHHRSHSQPARVRFADQDSDRSTSLGSMSDSDEYSPPRHSNSRHHGRHRSHSTRDYDSDRDRSDRDRDHRRHKPRKTHSYDKAHEEKHKNRDTFLGAGAGTIIGDAIFPGLGTAAGLLLGGYGGRKYADTRSKSDYDGTSKERRSHGGSRRLGDDGWDEKTRTYRKGAAVR
ncbi:unnamed protein product [Alternaria alternata]